MLWSKKQGVFKDIWEGNFYDPRVSLIFKKITNIFKILDPTEEYENENLYEKEILSNDLKYESKLFNNLRLKWEND